ncbi:capsule biosynthesis protein CapG [Lactiplantibacillus plantarum]|uniref:capsule biosynthesis protein CapG n=1 Tax=Lactiplantibacillus plantarum TaxID=1590 RepID=UPI0032184398
MTEEEYPVDIVVTWVNDDDIQWKTKRDKLAAKKQIQLHDERYRDFGTIKFFFRSIDKYCPWINKVFFITDHQVPDWLDVNNPKIKVIFHEDFIPGKYLPTFNSNVIELNLFRIKELSEHFVLFNDDTLVNHVTKKNDFFKNGLPKEFGLYDALTPKESFDHILVNDITVINKYFVKNRSRIITSRKFLSFGYGKYLFKSLLLFPWKRVTGYYNSHLPASHLKSTFQHLVKIEPAMFEKTFVDNFRIPENEINQWLIKYWNVESGMFEPQRVDFGTFLEVNEIDRIEKSLFHAKYKVICLNDVELNEENSKIIGSKLNQMLSKKFSAKSNFEI